MKTGVLIVNLGTPDDPSRKSVARYLKQFLMDPRVIDKPAWVRNILVKGIIVPFRSSSSAKLYQELWKEEGSPLKFYGEGLVEKVQDVMGDDYIVELAMRYQSPSIQSAMDKLMSQYVDRIVVFPLFPQYASATTGSVHEEVMRVLSGYQTVPDVVMINSYPDDERLAKLYADKGKAFDIDSYDHVLFSFHGLPQSQLKKADLTGQHCVVKDDCCAIPCDANKFCYGAQCDRTAKAIASQLDLPEDRYTICYQSRLGKDPWIQPYTSEILKERYEDHGDKNLLVFCPAFVADCLETEIEISVEYQEEFEEMGGEKVTLVPSLNDDQEWAELVSALITERIA